MDLQPVKELLNQLQALGYQSFQLREIIQETVGTSDLDSLSGDEIQSLRASLQEYVRFASKCWAINK